MANKDYASISLQPSGSMTKIRAEQIRSEDSFNSLAIDLEALRGQVKDIIGAGDYKEAIAGEYAKVQIVDLADHLDATSGSLALSVKKDLAVVGSGTVAGTLDVDGRATVASAIVESLGSTDGALVFHNTSKLLIDNGNLKFDGVFGAGAGALVAPNFVGSSLTAGRVAFVGTSKQITDDGGMLYNAGTDVLSVGAVGNQSTFGTDVAVNRDLTVGRDLTVTGDFRVNGALTYVNTTNLTVADAKIVISSGSIVDGAGIYLADDAAGENIRWTTADGGKWIASDKFMADTLQAGDLSDAPVAVDASGNFVEMDFSSWVAGTASQLIVSRSGTDFHGVTLSLPQDIATTSSPTFVGMTLSGLSSAPVAAGAGGALEEMDFSSWILGTSNQLIVSRSGTDFHGVTLSLPQDIHTGSSPQFAQVKLDGADNYVDSSANGLVLHAGLAGDSIVFEYDGSKSISLGTEALAGTFAATTIMGAINELKSTALDASKKATYEVGLGGVAAGTDVKASLSSDFIADLSVANGMVFVNGQLMLSGALGAKDYTVDGGVLKFTFSLAENDVVVVQKA